MSPRLENPAEEYLSLAELCERIPFAKGTIRNLISQGKLIEGYHFTKPGGKVIVFRWSRIQESIDSGGTIPASVRRKSLRSV